MKENARRFDKASAVTRSLLGWGVVAGPFYLGLGLVLALTRPHFDLAHDALSLLTLGSLGWIMRVDFFLAGIMTIAAAAGVLRLLRDGRGLAIGSLVALYGVGLILSGAFRPDPSGRFPVGVPASVTTGGTLHLVFGGLGFLSLAAAAFAFAAWCRADQVPGRAGTASVVLGVLLLLGFLVGAALSRDAVGLALLWLAVLAGWGWLALAGARLYRWTPHPVTGVRA